jgi:hypothetical protein
LEGKGNFLQTSDATRREIAKVRPEWFLQRFRRRPNTTADETGALDA